MPLGIVSEADFQKEINNHVLSYDARLYAPNEKVIDINRGRPVGRTEVPTGLRELVAGEALAGADVTVLIEQFNVSKSSISAYKHDATSTASYHKPDKDLQNSNDIVRRAIVGPAQSRLIKAIEAITDVKLAEASIKTASSVAKDMSTVIKNMEGPDIVVNNNQVHVYRPRIREEDSYEILQVNE